MSDAALAKDVPVVANGKPVARWRRIVGGLLVVLVCVLVPVSVLSVWLHNTLLDTDQYVDTVAPLAHDPVLQGAIATRITNTLAASTDLDARIADVLPAKAAFAAPAVANAIKGVVHDVALRLVESDQFATLWERANRRAHTQLVNVLEGKGRGNIETKNGQVVVRLGPVVQKAIAALEKTGINVFSGVEAERVNSQIVLLDSDQLRKTQSAVDLFDKLAIVLPILTIVLFAIAVGLSRNRRRTILRTGLGVAFAVALVLIAFNVARGVYLDALGADVNRDAAANVYDQLLNFLRISLRSFFVLGVIGAIGAWLAGPGETATNVREVVVGLFGGNRTHDTEPSAVATFVARHRSPLRVVVAAFGLGILVVLSHPGPIAVLTVAIVVLLFMAVIEALSRNASSGTDTVAH